MSDAKIEPAAKVEARTVPNDASKPSHPDHARWVRDKRTADDVSWLRSVGVEPKSRIVDAKIDQGLQRLEARKREGKKPSSVQPDRTSLRTSDKLALQHGGRLIRRPIQRRPSGPPYLCKKCGVCIRCRREQRARKILSLARRGDTKLVGLAHAIVKVALRAQARIGAFEHLSDVDAARFITRVVEDVCDRSVPIMGNWRP